MKNLLKRIHLLLILIAFFGCRENKNPCKLSEAVLKDIAKIDSLTKQPDVKERDRIWLNNYQEPSLISAQYETYRFIWSSSFDGVKIYRLEKINGKYKAVTKTFRDQGTNPGIREFPISSKTWNSIIDKLSTNGFWTYPSSIERNGLDGATWTLEGYKPTKNECTGKNYHRMTRWSPIDVKFIGMCELLTSLKQE
jgi:hypothetical protein